MHLLERAHVLHRAWRYRLRAERQEISFLLSRDLQGATVLDVGANRGVYCYWMHKTVGSDGNVIAFEPQVELSDYLHDLKNAFRLDRLTIVNAGLSSSSGARRLVRPHNHWGGASLELDPRPDTTDCLDIDVTTLCDYFIEHESLRPVRFIKCDIEGHEYECFLGGEQLLREDRPDLLFECRDARIDRLNLYLIRLGYEGFFFRRGVLTRIADLKQLRTTIAQPYLKYVFLPK